MNEKIIPAVIAFLVFLISMSITALADDSGMYKTEEVFTVNVHSLESGNKIEIFFEISSIFETSDIEAKIELSDDIKLLSGNLKWQYGNLSPGRAVQHKIVVENKNKDSVIWVTVDGLVYLPVQSEGISVSNKFYRVISSKVIHVANEFAMPVSLSREDVENSLKTSAKPSNPTETQSILETHYLTQNSNVIIDGYWRYLDKDNNSHIIKNATVELVGKGVVDYHIAWSNTDENGHYYFNSYDDGTIIEGPIDVYARVFADNPHLKVTDGNIFGISYWGATENYVVNGYKEFDYTITDKDKRGAWSVYSNIWDEIEFIKSETGWSRRKIDAHWPKDDCMDNGTPWPCWKYSAFGDYISIPKDSAYDRYVMFHEYGHAVMYAAYVYVLPSPINCPSPHFINSESNGLCAIVEGWAEFIQSAVDNNVIGLRVLTFCEGTKDIETNNWWLGMDCGTNNTGDIVEGAVASILWDIYDSGSSTDAGTPGVDDDGMSDGFGRIWSIIADNNPNNINQFWDAWFARGYGNWAEMAAIFEDHGIDKCPDSDGDGHDNQLCGGTDCDDLNLNIRPGAPESCNGRDDDCNGQIDDIDHDGDGYKPTACGGSDCNDNNPNINPGRPENCNNGIDDDCNGAADANDPDCVACSCGQWQDQGCGQNHCVSGQMRQTRTCNPQGCDTEVRCVSHQTCGTCDSSSYTSCQSAHNMQIPEGNTAYVRSHLCGETQYFRVTTTGTCDIQWHVKSMGERHYDLYTKWDGSCPSAGSYDCYDYTRGSDVTAICAAQDIPPGTYYMMAERYQGSAGYYTAYVQVDCPPPCEPQDEVCDGLDNNCNSQVDESLYQSCGSGLCQGTMQCNNGQWSACSTSGNDAGVCARCDSNGDPIYDSAQDLDCSTTLCPSDGCGLGGCGLHIFADFPYSVQSECSALYTCTSNACTTTCEADQDGDGWSPTCGDCDDTDNTIHSGASEICGDNLDNDCNGEIDEECMGSITGRIMEMDGTTPIGNALVSCTEQTQHNSVGEAYSLADGYYRIGGLETGTYYVKASYPGRATGIRLDVPVTMGFDTPDIDFRLSNATGSISGRVTDIIGSPLPDAYISLHQSRDPDNTIGEETFYIKGGLTDSDGYYYIGDLAPRNAYKLGIYGYSHNGTAYADAERHNIDVLDGQTHSGVDFILEEAIMVWGMVIDSFTGSPINNAYIYMKNDFTGARGSGSTDTEGFYEIYLLPGIYRMELEAQGYAGLLKLVNASQDTNLDFALGRGVQVSGRVTDSLGNPLSGMIPYTENYYFEGFGEVTTDANGYYSLHLLPGNYSLYAYDHSWDYAPVIPRIIELNEGDNVSGFDFMVSGEGSVSGGVADHTGGKISDLKVVAFGSDARLDILGMDHAMPAMGSRVTSMQYSLNPLAAGIYNPYLIISRKSIGGGRSITSLGNILGVNLSGSNITDMDFDIYSEGGNLTGTVTGSGPIGWATIVVTDMTGGFVGYALSSMDGAYILYYIPPGNYTIWAKKINYTVFSQNFSISEGEAKTLNIRLKNVIPPYAIGVYVFNTDSKPLADVPISLVNPDDMWFTNKTDANGYFEFEDFPLGPYELLICDIYTDEYPLLEGYTTIQFQNENAVNLTGDLEINAILLKIDTNITLNTSGFRNGSTVKANVTITNNEDFNLTDWMAFLVVEDKNDEDLHFIFNKTNLTARTTKSHIFEYNVPENDTYDMLKFSGGLCLGGVCGGEYDVESSEGRMEAINYKISDEIVINFTLLKGDANGDCIVNIFDLAAVGLAYNSRPGNSNWNPGADVTGDGIVNIFDLATVGLSYGEMC